MVGKAMPLKEIMIKDVKTIEVSATIHDAAKLMAKEKIGSLIVTEGDKLLGILTERDILKKVVATNSKSAEITVDEVMAFPLTTMRPYESVREAVEKMSEMRYRRMPVVDNGNLLGIVCDRDIFREAPLLMQINRDGGDDSDDLDTEEGKSGKCDDCRTFTYDLEEYEGLWLCPNCW